MNERDEKGRFTKGNTFGKKSRFSGGTAAEAGRKGGKATGEAKRERKHWKEIIEMICDNEMDIPMPDKTKKHGKVDEAIIWGQVRQAILGDTRAAKFLATMLGEYVERNETDLTSNGEAIGPTYIVKDEEEAEQLKRLGLL